MSVAIKVENLVKQYKKSEPNAVDDISFSVERGTVFGFLGPNGAGKTTTIKILTTLTKPTSGRAEIAGFNVALQRDAVRKSIGLVFQDQTLDENLTAYENLDFHGALYGMDQKKRKERISQVLEMVELANRSREVVKNFSGGMRRRLEIARGLMHFPEVLFLDEPTLGLDPQTRAHIWNYILKMQKKEKTTIFLTTHYMDEAENADQIAIIDKGKIIALGSPAELKKEVGGDVINLKTENNQNAAEEIARIFGITSVRESDGFLHFEVKDGSKFIPEFIRKFPVHVEEINVHKPTLDDVFLTKTGRALRDEESSKNDSWRQRHSLRSRRK